MIKLIIAGSRDLSPDFGALLWFFKEFSRKLNKPIKEIVSGGASGVDSEGEHLASHLDIEVKTFPADWDTHGKAAGPIRNKEMAKYADALLLIHNGSPGSLNMRKEMEKLSKPIYEVIINEAY